MLGVICWLLECSQGAWGSVIDHGNADIASSSGRPAEDEDEVLTECWGYHYGFKEPEESSPFFGENGVNASTRIIWAGHNDSIHDGIYCCC